MNKILVFLLIYCLFGCKKIEEENGKSIIIKFEVKNSTSNNLKLTLFRSNDSLFKILKYLRLIL
jgi:hypothetical protein